MSLLKGIRVLDVGRFIAGPYCAALLGDLGADVIRVERVQGGEDRYVPHVADTGEGGMFLQMNRNKRCLTLDLVSPQGRDIVRKLVQSADVAPGVGTTVKGGPTYREAQLCMEMIADCSALASLDVMELNPALDVRNQTAELAVDLIESLFGKSTLMRKA